MRVLKGHAEALPAVSLNSEIRGCDVCLLVCVNDEYPASGG
nr:hypothetical protein JVH1_8833 [Rhodococcus sp. JVH1]